MTTMRARGETCPSTEDGAMEPVIAYLALGSNMGDRQAHLHWAVERLGQTPGVEVQDVSILREVAPVDCPAGDPAFLNGAVRLRTCLSPEALLELCKALESERGRDLTAVRNSSRPLDLDLLLYGEMVVDTRDLQVPHPRLNERPFVLDPLRELGVDLDALPRLDKPRVIHLSSELSVVTSLWHQGHCTVGLVPTMGSLHGGHVSLVRKARRECDRIVVSIFVNPLQFEAGGDYGDYPRNLARDLEILRQEDVDVVFTPAEVGMHGDGFCTQLTVGDEARELEGAYRRSHFVGVVTVVAQLLAITRPQRAYFGRKDAQQVAVVRRMVADLGFPTAVVECPTCREPDGLALSSRNRYLSTEDRRAATVLYRALETARGLHRDGERQAEVLVREARRVVAAEPRARLEYLELRREGDLLPLPASPVHRGRMLVAAWFGEKGEHPARLIDNLSLVDPLEEV